MQFPWALSLNTPSDAVPSYTTLSSFDPPPATSGDTAPGHITPRGVPWLRKHCHQPCKGLALCTLDFQPDLSPPAAPWGRCASCFCRLPERRRQQSSSPSGSASSSSMRLQARSVQLAACVAWNAGELTGVPAARSAIIFILASCCYSISPGNLTVGGSARVRNGYFTDALLHPRWRGDLLGEWRGRNRRRGGALCSVASMGRGGRGAADELVTAPDSAQGLRTVGGR
jgi:hypothetical protein